MTAANHIVGGLAITGIIGSLMGINILEQESYIGVTIFAALLPDIDHVKSPIGKLFYPIAKIISKRYGHRTITHTLAALLILWAIVGTITKTYYETSDYGTIFFIAYTSHLVLDMMTIQGVPLFYPFLKSPCVIPGDPSLRMQSSDIKAEFTAFLFFCMMFVFFQPLMATGFWTQYNRLFGTMSHLKSEFDKSDDLLEVEYWGRVGSEKVYGKGQVIDAKESKAIIIKDGDFKVLDKGKMIIEKILPTHTGKQFFFDTKHFISIKEDSLNQLLIDQYVYHIEVYSDQPFTIWANGQVQPNTTRFKGDFFNNLYAQELQEAPEEQEIFYSNINPQIDILRDKLERTRTEQQISIDRNKQLLSSIDQLKIDIGKEQDIIKKELLYHQLKKLEKEKQPKDYDATITELQIKLSNHIKSDRIRNEKGRREVAKKNRSIRKSDTRFTGMIITVRFEN